MSDRFDTFRASHGGREIIARSHVWRTWSDAFGVAGIRSWFESLGVKRDRYRGAGASAYIGKIASAGLPLRGHLTIPSVSSNDLVSHPNQFPAIAHEFPAVIFGRSGDSSKCLGTRSAMDALSPQIRTPNIARLFRNKFPRKARTGRTISLPDPSDDAGFALTLSATTKLRAVLCAVASTPWADQLGHKTEDPFHNKSRPARVVSDATRRPVEHSI